MRNYQNVTQKQVYEVNRNGMYHKVTTQLQTPLWVNQKVRPSVCHVTELHYFITIQF